MNVHEIMAKITPEAADFLRVIVVCQAALVVVLSAMLCLHYAVSLSRRDAFCAALMSASYILSVAGNFSEMMQFWGEPPTYRLPVCLAVFTLGGFALFWRVFYVMFKVKVKQ